MKQQFFYFIVILSVFIGFKAWFFIGTTLNWPMIVSPVLFLLAFANANMFQATTNKVAFFIISYTLLAVSSGQSNIAGFIGNLMLNLPLFVIVFLRDRYRMEVLRLFDRVMFYVTIVSMLGWLFYLVKVPLPHSTLTFYSQGEALYQFENYYLFLGPNALLPSLSLFERFSSIFYEPGYYAIILVFLILYHRFDFKKREVWVYMAALVLTFSLAGYILFLLMLAGLSLSKSVKGIVYLVLIISLLYGGQEFFKQYNGGNNAVNELIIARMVVENGEWVGYNRTGKTFDEDFETFVKSGGPNLWMGVSQKGMEVNNVGWKVYIYQRGLLGFIAFIGCILLLYLPYKRNLKCALPAILYFLTFARGHYVMWFPGFWLLWVGIMNVYYHIENLSLKGLKIENK